MELRIRAEGTTGTGARSKKVMITRAIEELVNREAQLEMINWVQQGGLPGLTDPDALAEG